LRGDVLVWIKPHSRESWQRAIGRLRARELDSLALEWSTERRRQEGEDPLGLVEFQNGTATLSHWAAATIALNWSLARAWTHTACRVVAAAGRLAAGNRRATGAVGLAKEWPRPSDAWDQGMHLGWDLASVVPKYDWGTFLTPDHVARLGGLSNIRNAARWSVVREVGRERSAYLQLTPAVEAMGPRERRLLETLLRPVDPDRLLEANVLRPVDLGVRQPDSFRRRSDRPIRSSGYGSISERFRRVPEGGIQALTVRLLFSPPLAQLHEKRISMLLGALTRDTEDRVLAYVSRPTFVTAAEGRRELVEFSLDFGSTGSTTAGSLLEDLEQRVTASIPGYIGAELLIGGEAV
jgi:hypothetical protein